MNEELKKFEFEMIDRLDRANFIMEGVNIMEHVLLKFGMNRLAREFNNFMSERV